MNLSRRQFVYLATGCAALPVVSWIAQAQTYPSRPVRVIVGFAAGGSADIIARLMGQWLSERLGQQFIIENRPGAGTNIATAAVAEATPDGYTLLLVTAANFINATLYENLKFNFIRDIVPVASLSREPSVMVVHPLARFWSLSPTPRPIRERSPWRREETELHRTCPANCSRC
jgi:tripartite-type tricarboxylate transporter receptor subunit TctC